MPYGTNPTATAAMRPLGGAWRVLRRATTWLGAITGTRALFAAFAAMLVGVSVPSLSGVQIALSAAGPSTCAATPGLKANAVAYEDPASWTTDSAQTVTPGIEPLNVIISGCSTVPVTEILTALAELSPGWQAGTVSAENVDVTGEGSAPQQGSLRLSGDVIGNFKSLYGGENHARLWQQPKTGAWFASASYETACIVIPNGVFDFPVLWHCIDGGAGSYSANGYDRGGADFAAALVEAADKKGWYAVHSVTTGRAGIGEDGVSFSDTVYVVTVDRSPPPSASTTPTRTPAARAIDWGDTHLGTFDKGHYDFQQVGEYVVARSSVEDFEVQARQQPYGTSCSVAVNTAVAFHVAGHRVGVYLKNPGVHTLIDDQPAEVTGSPIMLPGGGSVRAEVAASQVIVDWPDGSSVTVHHGSGRFINLAISLAESERGHMSGLLGNEDGDAANDVVTSDGRALPSPHTTEQLYGDFSSGWRISQAESLFTYAAGQDTTTFTDPDFPCTFASVATLPEAAVGAATAACKAAGIVHDPYLEACILDVGATGDQEFAPEAAAIQAFGSSLSGTEPAPSPTPPATSSPAVTPTATLSPVATGSKVVLGTSGPWKFFSGGLNSAFPYSERDRSGFPTAPTLFSSADGLNFAEGALLHVRYVSGGTAQGAGYIPVDAKGNKGYACADPRPLSYGHCPSAYTSGPHLVMELIGVFTDSAGAIVGKPIVIGDGADLTIPAGATALSVGVNDSGYFNNSGTLQIAVS